MALISCQVFLQRLAATRRATTLYVVALLSNMTGLFVRLCIAQVGRRCVALTSLGVNAYMYGIYSSLTESAIYVNNK